MSMAPLIFIDVFDSVQRIQREAGARLSITSMNCGSFIMGILSLIFLVLDIVIPVVASRILRKINIYSKEVNVSYIFVFMVPIAIKYPD